MTDGVVDIGYVELFSASALMLVAGLVSWKLELGQTRRIAVSSVRCFVQLLAAGFLLTYLFEFQTWWLVLLVLAAMVIAATQIATSRVKSRIPGLVPAVFVSLFVSSTAIGLIVVEGVVHAEPWYNARQLVPIVGMIMGNAMENSNFPTGMTPILSLLFCTGCCISSASRISLRRSSCQFSFNSLFISFAPKIFI